MQVLTVSEQVIEQARAAYPGAWSVLTDWAAVLDRDDEWSIRVSAYSGQPEWDATLRSDRRSLSTPTTPGLPTPEAADAAIAAVLVWARGL